MEIKGCWKVDDKTDTAEVMGGCSGGGSEDNDAGKMMGGRMLERRWWREGAWEGDGETDAVEVTE